MAGARSRARARAPRSAREDRTTEQPPDEGLASHRGGRSRVDRALILRLRIYLAIVVVASGVTVVDVMRLGSAAVLPVVLGLVGGVAVGVLASRVSRLSWVRDAGKVVDRIDALGLVVLLGYLLLVVFKKGLLSQWFEPSLVGVASTAVLAGLMLGQAAGTAGGIARVLHAAVGQPGRRTRE